MTKQSQRGFTLVELSIVLVIIGLLIGGILVAQSMISTTKLQATVRQLGQFDAAVANFYTKFNQIPGDTSVMGLAVGNNDGWIDDSATTTHTYLVFDNEIAKFWSDLSANGLKPTGTAANYTDCSTTAGACATAQTAGTIVNTYIPQVPIGTNVGVMTYGTAAGTNNFHIGSYSWTVTTPTITVAPALKGAEAVAIDAKIDDGDGDSGSITGTAATTLNGAAGTTCQNAGPYVTSGTTAVCSLVVRIGVQTGLLQ